jgi:hypothetical protein
MRHKVVDKRVEERITLFWRDTAAMLVLTGDDLYRSCRMHRTASNRVIITCKVNGACLIRPMNRRSTHLVSCHLRQSTQVYCSCV